MEIKDKKPNIQKLKDFGFSEQNNYYTYSCHIVDEQFELKVIINGNELKTKLIDVADDSEYVLHLVENSTGAFVGRVREEYDKVLDGILKCFERDMYKENQTREIISIITKKYSTPPDFPFEDDEITIMRRNDNNKWYGAFMKVSAKKIGLSEDEMIEILNIKLKPLDIKELVDQKKYFPAYHMNKTHWITILLGRYASNEEILELIDQSYTLVGPRRRMKK